MNNKSPQISFVFDRRKIASPTATSIEKIEKKETQEG